MGSTEDTLAFINSRTPEQIEDIAARLIEELVEKNDKLKREVEFLRSLMESYVAKYEQEHLVAGGRK
jgi:hypothetical protein